MTDNLVLPPLPPGHTFKIERHISSRSQVLIVEASVVRTEPRVFWFGYRTIIVASEKRNIDLGFYRTENQIIDVVNGILRSLSSRLYALTAYDRYVAELDEVSKVKYTQKP